MEICWPLRNKTLAHERRRRGAGPRLADAIVRVISERKVMEQFEVSLVSSMMAQINRGGSEEITSDNAASNNGSALIQSCLDHAGISRLARSDSEYRQTIGS